MIENLLSQLAPSLPWASVQYRQGRVSKAQVKEFGQIAVRLNPDLLSLDVLPGGSGYEAVLNAVLEDLLEQGFELRETNESFTFSSPIDFGLENGDFPLLADAGYVLVLRSAGLRDLARRITVAICLLDGFRFDHFLDWWIESIEEMAADVDGEEELEEGEQTYSQLRVADLKAIKISGRMFGCFARLLYREKSGKSVFLARFKKEIEEWNPASSIEEAWKEWIIDAIWWREKCSEILENMPGNDDSDGVRWQDLVGFGWDNDTFWEEYDGMVNSQYEGGGVAHPGSLELTKENALLTKETTAGYMDAFGGLCRLINRFNSLKEQNNA